MASETDANLAVLSHHLEFCRVPFSPRIDALLVNAVDATGRCIFCVYLFLQFLLSPYVLLCLEKAKKIDLLKEVLDVYSERKILFYLQFL